MQVVISVPGTFHGFNLATQLEKRNALRHIYSTYPQSKLNTQSLPSGKVTAIRYPEILTVLQSHVPFLDYGKTMKLRNLIFSKSIARRLERMESGIYVGFAGSSLYSLRRAETLGLTTVVERSSSHIRTQLSILSEEYRRHGMDDAPVVSAAKKDHLWPEETEYAEADYIVTPSEFSYQSFVEQGFSEERVMHIPFGVDTEQFSPQRSTGPFRVLYAGDVSYRKGIPYLLEAWEQLSLDNAELIVAGNIDEDIQDFIEDYRSNDSIRFLGWVDDIHEWYKKSSVFALPSLEEGSAYVTYEAMAAGLPLIATFNSGWVGEDREQGIEVPIRDADEIAAAIKSLYEDETRRRAMGESARRLMETEYTWEDYGRRVHERYQEMIEEA